MTVRGVIGFLFVFYCLEGGALLVMLPWSPYWDRLAVGLPLAELRLVALQPWIRGAVSGFGLLHIVWGAHDLDAWLTARRRRRQVAP